jgi:hypothetical protein
VVTGGAIQGIFWQYYFFELAKNVGFGRVRLSPLNFVRGAKIARTASFNIRVCTSTLPVLLVASTKARSTQHASTNVPSHIENRNV